MNKNTSPVQAEDRTRVNHGHDRWDGKRFVPDYQPWCAACRKAKGTR